MKVSGNSVENFLDTHAPLKKNSPQVSSSHFCWNNSHWNNHIEIILCSQVCFFFNTVTQGDVVLAYCTKKDKKFMKLNS